MKYPRVTTLAKERMEPETIGRMAAEALARSEGPGVKPNTKRGRTKGSKSENGRGFSSDRKTPLFEIADTRKVRRITPALAAIYYRSSSALHEKASFEAKEAISNGATAPAFAAQLSKTLHGAGTLFAVGSAFERAWLAKNWTDFGIALEVAERLAILALTDPRASIVSHSLARWSSDRVNSILRKRGAHIPRDTNTSLPAPEVSDSAYIAGLVEFGDTLPEGGAL